MNDQEQLEILRETFLSEATEFVSSLESQFMELEQAQNDSQKESLLRTIFRHAHSLKGSAGAVGLDDINSLTHELENLICKAQNDLSILTEDVLSLMLDTVDATSLLIEQHTIKTPAKEMMDPSSLIKKIKRMNESSQKDKKEEPQSFMGFFDDEAEDQEISQEDVAKTAASSSPSKTETSTVNRTVPVASHKLDQLVSEVSQLKLLLNVLFSQHLQKNHESLILSREITKTCSSVQDTAISAQLVSAQPLIQRMKRIVRDSSKELSKEVNFTVKNEDIQIDRGILEGIQDPLIHIIRNSIDHGIEDKETRAKKGKNIAGNVLMTLENNGSDLAITIEDDGAGINVEKVKQKALKNQLITEDQAKNMPEEDALRLIFQAGLSTKEQVTSISGRGVGMDVVQANIQSMQGKIKITNKPTGGTCLAISLPLNLAFLDTIHVAIGENQYLVPKTNITEVISVEQDLVNKHQVLDESYVMHRNRSIPVFYLEDMLGKPRIEGSNAMKLMIFQENESYYGVSVPEVKGSKSITRKPVDKYIKAKGVFLGSTILESGKPVLILNMKNLGESLDINRSAA